MTYSLILIVFFISFTVHQIAENSTEAITPNPVQGLQNDSSIGSPKLHKGLTEKGPFTVIVTLFGLTGNTGNRQCSSTLETTVPALSSTL